MEEERQLFNPEQPPKPEKPDKPDKHNKPEKPQEPKDPAVRKALRRQGANLLCIFIAVLLVILAAGMMVFGLHNGSQAVKKAFEAEKAAAEESVYHAYYEQGYNAAEAEYHVKNRAAITLGNIRETADLEVLSISDIAYMIENPSGENKQTTSWLEVPGTGVFTVNLGAGEFLADDERSAVYVRLPKPEILPMNINIDHANVKVLRFSSNALLSSVREGEQLAGKQLNEARTKILEDIGSNVQYYEFAENSARTLLENLIRAVNSEIPDLRVEIEFY